MNPAEWKRLETLLNDRIRAVVIEVLTEAPIVTNRVSKTARAADADAKPSKGSVTWALSNIEGDQDDDRDAERSGGPLNPV